MTVDRHRHSLLIIRVAVATLLIIHGSFRAVTDGYVSGFGEFLDSWGIPLGTAVATGLTAFEILGGLALAVGRWIRPLAVLFALELAAGVVMVHASEGWFVVGGGRNGMEYSVLLIICLLAVARAEGGGAPVPDDR